MAWPSWTTVSMQGLEHRLLHSIACLIPGRNLRTWVIILILCVYYYLLDGLCCPEDRISSSSPAQSPRVRVWHILTIVAATASIPFCASLTVLSIVNPWFSCVLTHHLHACPFQLGPCIPAQRGWARSGALQVNGDTCAQTFELERLSDRTRQWTLMSLHK